MSQFFNFIDNVVATSSKDNTFKMFMVDLEYENTEMLPKFDSSSFEIKNILCLDSEHLLAYSEKSK